MRQQRLSINNQASEVESFKRFSNETPVSVPQPQMPLITTEPESSGGSAAIVIPENAYVSELVGYQETSRPYVRSIELHVKPFPKPQG